MNQTDLDQRLRTTLTTVAATVDTAPLPQETNVRRQKTARRRGFIVGAGLVFAAAPIAAGASLGFGPEHVDRLPPPNQIVAGSIDGERYWIVDAFHSTDECDIEAPGVEIVPEGANTVGGEWNTFRNAPPSDGSCGESAVPDEPASGYYLDGGVEVGDGMLWSGFLPSGTEVVATTGAGDPDGDSLDVNVFMHEGDRYFWVEVEPEVGVFTVDFTVDGIPAPPPAGETNVHTLP